MRRHDGSDHSGCRRRAADSPRDAGAATAQGYEIVEARDGQEALEKMKEKPDLVILDMNLPVMDGLEACRAIRAASSVPVIMLTVRSARKATSKSARSMPVRTTMW